jgi:hypothetical protein
MDLGMPAAATTSRKAASKASISTSTRQVPTTQDAAFNEPDHLLQ